MKKTGYLTFGAVMSALAVVTMLMSYVPTLTYSIPALAGMFIMVVVIEIGPKWALFSYISAAIVSMLVAEPEAALFFVLLFGCYPIIKVYLERIKLKPVAYICKLLIFNAAVVLIFFVFMKLMGVETDFGGVEKYVIAGVWVLANAVFLVYDYAVKSVSNWYFYKLHSRVSKMIKR
ncbi:MAG: hypothetical protein IKL62_06840 [Clostridia bacterium]|nr:hypothetical protein [Oscillospiraceae bacterium]MBR6694645.1 hypothetical protein [Clostridia bacterium]